MEKTVSLVNAMPTAGWIVLGIAIVLIICLAGLAGFYFIRNRASIQIGSFRIDMSEKESVKEPKSEKEKEIAIAKKNVEEYLRSVIAKQYDQVVPFLASLRPIFNRLVFSILNDAVAESLGVEKEIRIPQKDEKCEIPGSHYKVETVKTYVAEPQTRVFTNLVESAVDSLICKLEREIYNMLINNNIGKNRDDVRHYIHMKSENIVGIIRNTLCDAYNSLSNKNLFDTTKYWSETGITYPTDWIEDKLYKLFVLCLQCRYSDFDE